jgi:hypothetical protein
MSDGTYELPDELVVEVEGPVRVIRLNRPDQLNATNEVLHRALADVFPQLDADRAVRAAATSATSTSSPRTRRCGARPSSTPAGSSPAW